MKFSVVIPLYNKAAYIEATLGSVLAQTWSDFEVVVVDDGSHDAGPHLVTACDDPRIRLIRQANAGVSVARNTGIAEARGEWIVFLDADDWQHPMYLQTLAELAAAHPQADALATHYRSVAHTDVHLLTPWATCADAADSELITDLPRRWMQGTCLFTGSIAVRRSLLAEMAPCFPGGESFGEDLDVWFRVAERSPIAYSARPLVARVWVPEGLSVTHVARLEAPFLSRMEQRAPRLPAPLAASTRCFVDESRVTLARTAISAGHRAMALGLLWRARRAASRPRWWVTLLMTLLVPGQAVHQWQYWRKRRKMLV